MLNNPFYSQYQQFNLCANLYNSYMNMIYMQAFQNQALFMNRFPPLNVITNKNQINQEEKIQSQRLSENTTIEDFQTFYKQNPSISLTKMNFSSCLKKDKKEKKIASKYIFSTVTSRKKEKKNLKLRLNRIISRVHNMDCLLKKIKAKYLKYLFIELRVELSKINVEMKKFDQCGEVRNLNVSHNRDNFIDLTVLQMLINNAIIRKEDIETIVNFATKSVLGILNKKVKYHYQFDFLSSKYFKSWIKDPIKISKNEPTWKNDNINKNCLKFPNHSKNIFKKNKEDYEIYIKLLLQTSTNFIFYFQNNPLKFGKKAKLSS